MNKVIVINDPQNGIVEAVYAVPDNYNEIKNDVAKEFLRINQQKN